MFTNISSNVSRQLQIIKDHKIYSSNFDTVFKNSLVHSVFSSCSSREAIYKQVTSSNVTTTAKNSHDKSYFFHYFKTVSRCFSLLFNKAKLISSKRYVLVFIKHSFSIFQILCHMTIWLKEFSSLLSSIKRVCFLNYCLCSVQHKHVCDVIQYLTFNSLVCEG